MNIEQREERDHREIRQDLDEEKQGEEGGRPLCVFYWEIGGRGGPPWT